MEVERSVSNKVAKGELVINVKDYGAKGDGVTNDTDAFASASAAINAAGGGTLFIPKGTYIVGKQTFANGGGKSYSYLAANIVYIHDCDGVTILADGATLKIASGLRFGSFDPITGEVYTPGSLPFVDYNYAAQVGNVLDFYNNDSVTISGNLEIDGNMDNIILGGQFGDAGYQLGAYGVRLRGSSRAMVQNVYVHHNCLDGLYVGQEVTYDGETRTPHLFMNCRSEYNGRQAISIAGGRGISLISCSFNYSGAGTVASEPKSGVDIEGELGVVREVYISGCEIIGNYSAGLIANTGDSADVRVSDTDIIAKNSHGYAVSLSKPRFTFTTCKIAGGVLSTYGVAGVPQNATRFIDCYITDETSVMGSYAVYRCLYTSDAVGTQFNGCRIVNSAGYYISLTGSSLNDCKLIHLAGTESNAADKSAQWFLNNTTLNDVQIINKISSLPANGYYMQTSVNTIFVGDTRIIDTATGAVNPVGMLKFVSWDVTAGGYNGYGMSGVSKAILTKTASYTATTSDYTILGDATSTGITITLPAATSNTGRVYVIKKIDSSANTVTIDGNASETIDGATTKVLSSQWETVTIQCDGSGWFVV